MKTAPKLKQMIEQLAEKHVFDLYQVQAYLRLDLNEDKLIIENIGASRISIAYHFLLYGKWAVDPEIVIWTTDKLPSLSEEKEGDVQWVPIELYDFQYGWRACANIDHSGALTAFYRRDWQTWLADYVETVVVANLISQRWLEQGIKSDDPPPSYTPEEMRERGYLLPPTDIPYREVSDDIPF